MAWAALTHERRTHTHAQQPCQSHHHERRLKEALWYGRQRKKHCLELFCSSECKWSSMSLLPEVTNLNKHLGSSFADQGPRLSLNQAPDKSHQSGRICGWEHISSPALHTPRHNHANEVAAYILAKCGLRCWGVMADEDEKAWKEKTFFRDGNCCACCWGPSTKGHPFWQVSTRLTPSNTACLIVL